MAQPTISRRIAEIRNGIAAERQRDVAAMIAELDELRKSARASHHFGAAVRAVEMKARLKGLLGDRLPLPFPADEVDADPEPAGNAGAPDLAHRPE